MWYGGDCIQRRRELEAVSVEGVEPEGLGSFPRDVRSSLH